MDAHSLAMIAVFIIGYLLITLEHFVKIDKAATALLMGVILWVIQFHHAGLANCGPSIACLGEHIFSISQIVFFLLGALAIVAVIDSHNGFALVANMIKIHSKRKLLWVIGFLAFFLSAILDNLTTTIVMVTLLAGLMERTTDRLIIGGGVVIAANAGGVWTPIGDVTTTMLWIGGQISTVAIVRDLFIPSLVAMMASLAILSLCLKGKFPLADMHKVNSHIEPMGKLVFFLGIGILIFVPIFKILTGLPPFMGILFGLGLLWLVTDVIHAKYAGREHLRVPRILSKVEFTGLLFFLGILLAIDALDSAGILKQLAGWLNEHLPSTTMLAALIGLASAVVDNVPLVAATMGMYPLDQFPIDHPFWQKIAYAAGTGGSILIIGSAAGVVYMALEKVDFLWYLKKISFAALIGFFAGLGAYLLLNPTF
jgi:Na+/H+ antiporter NhaD/arsenite permease-like protein